MRKDDPYHDRKVYHFASQINSLGGVSALCFASPRPINLKVAMWTNSREAVTCRKCRTILADLPVNWKFFACFGVIVGYNNRTGVFSVFKRTVP